MAIDPISASLGSIAPSASPLKPSTGTSEAGFGDTLQDLLGEVDGSAADANQAIGKMLNGTGDVHEAMIAIQRADTMLQLTVQVRNKLVQAYQDIMRMPV